MYGNYKIELQENIFLEVGRCVKDNRDKQIFKSLELLHIMVIHDYKIARKLIKCIDLFTKNGLSLEETYQVDELILKISKKDAQFYLSVKHTQNESYSLYLSKFEAACLADMAHALFQKIEPTYSLLKKDLK